MTDRNELNELFGDDSEEEQEQVQQENSSTTIRSKSNGVACFHNGTEEAMWLYVQRNAKRNNIDDILLKIDEFCYERHWMMHMGDKKRTTVIQALQQAKDKYYNNTAAGLQQRDNKNESFTVVELGSYCGYSALCLGKELSKEKREHMYCIENHINCVKWTKQLIEYAGLQDCITVIHSTAGECQQWKNQLTSHYESPHTADIDTIGQEGLIDFLFIDHDKKVYYNDLLIIEQAKLLRSGCIVVADNVLCFNCPLTEYLNHVRDPNGSYVISTLHEGYLEYTTEEDKQDTATIDGIEISVYR